MRSHFIASVAALAACGRIGFDATDAAPPLPRVETYVKASNTDAGDTFGHSLGLSSDGKLLAVGAYQEQSNATGVDGNQPDNSAHGAGAVYVFARDAAGWAQHTYLKASNTGVNDQFGFTVALSGDGHTIAVDAPLEASNATGVDGDQTNNSAVASGAVYIFSDVGGTWAQQAYVKASNTDPGDQFGYALAVSRDGNTLAVGARNEDSSSRGIDGNQADNGTMNSGAVYVFVRAGATWTQQAYIKAAAVHAGDELGWSVSLSDDGNTLAVGAAFESSNAVGIDGDPVNQLAVASGSVYVFSRTGTTWSQQAYVKASNTGTNDFFGWSVALSGDASTLAVGALAEQSAATGVGGDQLDNNAPSSGAVYVFTRTGPSWTQQAFVKAANTDANDYFGNAVGLTANGDELVVSATVEASAATGIDGDLADNSAAQAGAAYVYVRLAGAWTYAMYLKATNTDAGDTFGQALSVAASSGAIAIGANAEAGAATGVDGDASSNAAAASGAGYLFE